ncbi:MAG: hypothetical protein M3R17_20280 [Bacteroidota bacterium]|nr:hypothetical protein [Bacteroidota bacterium]
MNNNVVSRHALLRGLDTLEQICRKRVKNELLIDDEQLPKLVTSTKEALVAYAAHYEMPELSKTASEFPKRIRIMKLPYVIEVLGVIVIFCVVFNIAYWGPYGFFLALYWFFLPVILPGIVMLFVRYKFKKHRNELMNEIACIAERAKVLVGDNQQG